MSENIKPVAHQYLFTSPFGNGDVWRDNLTTWNGQYAKQSRPLYDQSAIEAARQESAAEIAELRRQLASAEAIESKLRVSLEMMLTLVRQNAPELSGKVCGYADDALSQTVGSGALDTLLTAKEREATAKAVAETIERCAHEGWMAANSDCEDRVKASILNLNNKGTTND